MPLLVTLGAEGAATGLGTITNAITEWLSLAGQLLTVITTNPVLCFIFSASLVFTGIHIVSALKHA